MAARRPRRRPRAEPGAEPGADFRARSGADAAGFTLFEGDGLNRTLALLGLGARRPFAVALRITALVLVTWGVLAVLAWSEGHLTAERPREAFLSDLAAYAQFLGFIPLSIVAEVFIGAKMALAVRHLAHVCDGRQLAAVTTRTQRLAQTGSADIVCLALGYFFTLLWACNEVSNGISTWHTEVLPHPQVATGPGPVCVALICGALGKATSRHEIFTLAGGYVAFFCLPLFTYLWLRWVWKVIVWTSLLIRVSRLRLGLIATHPDATGGLGSLSDVQTSFGIILFGTGILFSTAIWYKVALEQTPVSTFTVWVPIAGYVLLAPAVFIGPLFVFSRALHQCKSEALLRFSALALELSRGYEQRWVRNVDTEREQMLSDPQTSSLADFKTHYKSVEEMRVVPFDWRSLKELFLSAAGPFVPAILDFVELPQQAKDFLKLWVG